MKAMFAALILSISTPSLADGLVDQIAGLPEIGQPKVEIDRGPAEATVQPTVWLSFEFSSCAHFNLQSSVTEADSLRLVAVSIDPMQRECYGPLVKRTYRLQLASDYSFERYVVLNPIKPTDITIADVLDHRMCTMEAGVLYNPATDSCIGYTNGCQKHDLESQGLLYPQGNECGAFGF